MDATKVGNSSLNWTAVIEQLIEGHELSERLGSILEEASPAGASIALIKEISGSFSRARIALETDPNFSGNKRMVECENRGRRNRRKGNNLIRTMVVPMPDDGHSWRKYGVVPTPDDGHSWRKYGQKTISNSEFPRGYFRCIHRYDQKCLATKRVQQSKDNPSLFLITYIDEHTCQDLDSLEPEAPRIVDFGSSAPTTSGTFTLGSSSSDCITAREMDVLDESESVQLVAELMGGASENGDTMPWLQPSSDHDQGWYFVEGLFHDYGYSFGL